MELLPIKTRRIEPQDDLMEVLNEGMKVSGFRFQVSDIIVISSKAVATAEGRIVNLSAMTPSENAKKFAQQCGRSPAFCEAVLKETNMRNGTVRGTCPGAMITELKPWGASIRPFGATQHDTMGTIITANAGLDESNTEKGTAVGWPEDPVRSASEIRERLQRQCSRRKLLVTRYSLMVKNFLLQEKRGTRNEERGTSPAVIITDSCIRPRRWGVTAFALAVAGIDPLKDEAGREDLFGRKLRITKEAIADQLSTAANMLMGNADQSTPAVIIRDHGLMLSEYEGWVPGIAPEEDLFKGIV